MVVDDKKKIRLDSQPLGKFSHKHQVIHNNKSYEHLDVKIDSQPFFNDHFICLRDKCDKLMYKLWVVCPNLDGYSNGPRRLMYQATGGAIWRRLVGLSA